MKSTRSEIVKAFNTVAGMLLVPAMKDTTVKEALELFNKARCKLEYDYWGSDICGKHSKNLKSRIKELESQLEKGVYDAGKLMALESAGVDNWEGYDYAMEILEEWRKEDE